MNVNSSDSNQLDTQLSNTLPLYTSDSHQICSQCQYCNLLTASQCLQCGHLLPPFHSEPNEASSKQHPASNDMRAFYTDPLEAGTKLVELAPDIVKPYPRFIPKFIVTHWRGNYGLAKSYWVVGFLVLIARVIISGLINYGAQNNSLGIRANGAFIITDILQNCILFIWLIVGIWRSSRKHKKRGGSGFVAGLTQCIVVLNGLHFCYNVIITFPAFVEATKMVGGIDSIPPYKITLLHDGTELELSGGIRFGIGAELEQVLARSPKVKTIHLNSIGGRTAEGYRLNDIIRAHQLNTYSSSYCYSSCTIAFAAGKNKYLSNAAKLGFHSSSVGGQAGIFAQQLNQGVAQTYRASGMAEGFIQRAIATSPDDLWIPSTTELLQAHAITEVVDPANFGISGLGKNGETAEIEKDILQNPTYVALAKYAPADYAQFKTVYVTGIQQGKTQHDIQNEIKNLNKKIIFNRYLKIAPDSELVEFWRSELAKMKSLALVNVRYCAAYNYPDQMAVKFDLTNTISKSITSQYNQALAALIKGAVTNPKTAKLTPTVQNLIKQSPIAVDFFNNSPKFKSNISAMCHIPLDFYGAIVNLPTNHAGSILRFLRL